ncbi:MAG: DUF1631 family protein [Betaproteobacteria bacterium]|nr:DUF1631 family protein [Betaproteobacteria bacterium]
MSSSGSNVFSFPANEKSESGASGVDSKALIAEIRTLAVDRISAAAATGFDKIVDELYDLAEHALERDTRDFYLQAKEKWPAQRAAIETALKEELGNRFSVDTAKSAKSTAEFSQLQSSWNELSLVDDGVLEEDMRFTEIAAKIRNGADEELAALDQRMAVLLDQPDLEPAESPLSPAGLSAAFRSALGANELDLKVKLIVIRAFDEAARPAIVKLYKDVNKLLKDSGVLPTVRYGSTKKPQTGTGPMSGPKAEAGGPQVVGSVTLPLVSGGPSGSAGVTMGAGIPVGIAGVAAPSAAGAAGPVPGAATIPGAPGATATGGTASAGAGGALDAGGDPFAMLQQLLMMNMAAGRLPGAPGGTGAPADAGPPGVPAGGAPGTPQGSPQSSAPGGAWGTGGSAQPPAAFPAAFAPGGGAPAGGAGPAQGGDAFQGSGPMGGGFGGSAGAAQGSAGGAGWPAPHGTAGQPGPFRGGAPADGASYGTGDGGGQAGGSGSGTGGSGPAGGYAGGPVQPGAGPGSGSGAGPSGSPDSTGAWTPVGRAGGPGGPGHTGTGVPGSGTPTTTGTFPDGRTDGPGTSGGPAWAGSGGPGAQPGSSPGGGPAGYPGGGGYPTGAAGPAGIPGSGGAGAHGGSAPPGVVTPTGFPAPPTDGTGMPGVPGQPTGEVTNTFGTLAGLLPSGATGSHRMPTGGIGGPGGRMHTGLIGSLTRLQQGDLGAFPDVPADIGDWLSARQASLPTDDLIAPAPNVLRALKSTSFGQQMGQMDTVTLDIVAMLFDQIFGDGRIPPAMKALIGRLQIPMLKVAMLDKTFFSRKTHPARRMLDTLGELSMGLGDGFALGTPLYHRIESTLTQLIEQFEEDFGVFDRITEQFEAIIGELNQTADAAGKRESKRIQDKERLEVARLFAQNELKARIEGHELPRAVLRFLSTEWMKLLILAYAKGGRESRAWASLVETLDILVWSLVPKHTVDERKRLVSILPGLLKRLAKGMDVIGTDKLMRERFNAVLMRCHARTIAGGTATSLFQKAPSLPATTAKAGASVANPPVREPSDARPAVPVAPPADVPEAAETPWQVSPELSLSGLSQRPPGAIPPEERAPAEETQPEDRHAQAPGSAGMTVEEVSFEQPGEPGLVHDITEPLPEEQSGLIEPAFPARQESEPPAPAASESLPIHEELSAEPPPEVFPSVKVKNPFGDGEIEVEEVSFNDLPGFSSSGLAGTAPPPAEGDEFSQTAARLKEGDWVEIHQEGRDVVQARLSYVSPYRSTFVFSNRKGQKVAEYSSYQVTSYLRNGRLTMLEDTPLFDRAFGNLVNILRKGAEAA